MATPYEIPTSPILAHWQTIMLAGTAYRLGLTWCEPAQLWTLEIDDAAGARILAGVPLVTGADLLAAYAYLGPDGRGWGGRLYAQSDFDYRAPPTLSNLGRQGHLYFVADD